MRLFFSAMAGIAALSLALQPSVFAQSRELPPSERIALTDGEIQMLAGFKTIGEVTSRLQRRPVEERRAIYLAVAAERKVLPAAEADAFFAKLGRVEGFDGPAKTLCSGSSAAVNGALHELRLAHAFVARGATIIELRKLFKGDPGKKSTDIDLLIEVPGGRRFAIETKSYGKAPLDLVNRDVATLLHFVDANPTVRPVLSLPAEPAPVLIKQLATKNVLLISGTPAEQAEMVFNLAP